MAPPSQFAPHPVLDLLDKRAGNLVGFVEAVSATSWSSAEETRVIGSGMSTLAEELRGLDHFTLHPMELVDIWAKVVDIFPNRRIRYRFAALISGAFAVQSVDETPWKEFPKQFAEQAKVPDELTGSGGLHIVRQQLAVVTTNVNTARANMDGPVTENLYENFNNGLGAMVAKLARAS